ncbi:hypothetical protein pb186bvf_003485 [Paramecium bursaria]
MAKDPKNEENQTLVSEPAQFQKGEYLIHVLIQQTRGLSSDKIIDPLICIEGFKQKKYSTQKAGASPTCTTLWNEHFHFTQRFAEGRLLNSCQIKFTVLDHKLFGSDAIIGIYDLDFSTVYLQENHALLHKWVGLINPQKDFNQITGFIKISINIVGEGDKQTTLCQENEIEVRSKIDQGKDQNIFGDGNLLLPPHIQARGQQLKITLLRAEKLIRMDNLLGSIDPFVIFEVGGLQINTDKIDKNQNPVWDLMIYIPITNPCSSENLIIRVFDYDMGQKDEIIATNLFKISDILRGQYVHPTWVNLYGAQNDAEQDQRIYLCSHPDLGTCYSGRLQLAIEVVENPRPQLKKEKINDKELLTNLKLNQTLSWECHCDAFYVINCPKEDEDYSLKMCWGEYEVQTNKEEARNGVCEFYKHLAIFNAKFPFLQSRDLPDVFLYLMDGDKPICFKRFKNSDILQSAENQTGKHITVNFLPDKSIKNTPLNWYHKNQASYNPIRCLDEVIRIKKASKSKLRKTHDILSRDSDGLADPMAEILFYDLKTTTSIINRTISPIWNTQHVLNTYNFEKIPPIIIKFFDKDTVGRDFLGQVIIDYYDGEKAGYILRNSDKVADPQWIDINIYGQNAGQVLLSVNYNDNPNVKIPQEIAPKAVKHFVKMKLLGLRALKSYAFVKFNVESIKQPNEKNEYQTAQIITQPKDSGSNPNIQTIITFEINLPEDDAYMPRLPGSVHDYVMKGLLQPLIGQLQVNLKQQKEKTIKQIKQKIEVGQRVLSDASIINDNYIHIPEEELLGPSDDKDILTQLEMIKNNSINVGMVIKYVQYQKNENEGTFEEIDQFAPQYVPLGYDTQLQKANLYMLRNNKQGKSFACQNNTTAKASLQLELDKQVKRDKIITAANQLIKKQKFIQDSQNEQSMDTISDIKQQEGIMQDNLQIIESLKSKKHYRLCLPCPLENSLFMSKNTFDNFNLHKGINSPREAETMADLIFEELKQMPTSKLFMHELDFSQGKSTTQTGDMEIITKSAVTVQIYILDCSNLPPKDFDSMSDPYIQIKLGDQVVDNQKEYKQDDCNPKFYKLFTISTELPGASDLIIQVYDYDDLYCRWYYIQLFIKELIGQTVIDIEERYSFQQRFRQLKHVPIETRQLYHPSSSISQGDIRLFVEIIPSKQASILRNPWFIDQRPKANFFVRLVVWEVYDVPIMDIEGTSDIYVLAYIDEKVKQTTDTHYRSQNGRGSFNWRMAFPLELPRPETVVSFQVFDKDIFSPDDFIADCTYDLTKLANKAFENEINLKLYGQKAPPEDGILKQDLIRISKKNGTQYEKVAIQTENVQKDGYKTKKSGVLVISLEIIPESIHLKNQVGLGRSQPNHSPFCPEPTGRIDYSWNPIKMLKQLLGPTAQMYVLLGLFSIFGGYLGVMFLPIISGAIIANWITG